MPLKKFERDERIIRAGVEIDFVLYIKRAPARVSAKQLVCVCGNLASRIRGFFSRFDNNEGNSSLAGVPKPPLSRKELVWQ